MNQPPPQWGPQGPYEQPGQGPPQGYPPQGYGYGQPAYRPPPPSGPSTGKIVLYVLLGLALLVGLAPLMGLGRWLLPVRVGAAAAGIILGACFIVGRFVPTAPPAIQRMARPGVGLLVGAGFLSLGGVLGFVGHANDVASCKRLIAQFASISGKGIQPAGVDEAMKILDGWQADATEGVRVCELAGMETEAKGLRVTLTDVERQRTATLEMIASSQEATTTSPGRSPTPAPVPEENPEADLPWIAQVRANCAAYKAAPNEIKKSAIFSETQALVGGVKVVNARGRLSGLQTNQGGSELKLTVQVGRVEFTTESLLSPVKRGSAVYNAASEMRTGQCVLFSAERLRPSSMSERAKVCDTEYFANFTSLASCE